MSESRPARWARRQSGLLLLVTLWLLGIAWLVLGAGGRGTSATAGLFQSGLATETPTAAATLAPTATQPEVPAATPTALAQPTPQPDAPTQTPTPTATAPSPQRASEESTPAGPAVQASADPGRYPTREAELDFDWSILLDALALGASYSWLACGATLLLVAVPLFVVLARMSRRHKG